MGWDWRREWELVGPVGFIAGAEARAPLPEKMNDGREVTYVGMSRPDKGNIDLIRYDRGLEF